MTQLKAVADYPFDARVLPHNGDLERLILGALMLDPRLFAVVCALLDEKYFFLEVHRLIFVCMKKLHAEGLGFEYSLFPEEISAVAFSLCDGSFRTTELPQLCEKLRAHWQHREAIKSAMALEAALFSEGDPGALVLEHQARMEKLFEPGPGAPAGFQLYDLGNVQEWPAPELRWKIQPLIPENGIGFLSAPPKDGKSLLATDLVIHLAQSLVSDSLKWLGHFKCEKSKVLYIAREDPARRIKERAVELNGGYGFGPIPLGAVSFLIRDRFNLLEASHVDWLYRQVKEQGFDFLIFDVLNRMIPGLDELSAKDMAVMVTVLEQINRDLGVTMLLIDHTRKPQGPRAGRNKQEPNPFDLKGSVAKYGCADYMICLARTEQDGRLQVYCESKDSDERPHFFLDVSPKGSGKPKFRWAGDVGRMAGEMRAIGDGNRSIVLSALGDTGASTSEIVAGTGLNKSTVKRHLAALLDSGQVDSVGQARNCRWFTKPNRNGPEPIIIQSRPSEATLNESAQADENNT
ncbi:MAG: AAA family ATPase [Acidobacteriota bacterium]